jgi:hypothetical protein
MLNPDQVRDMYARMLDSYGSDISIQTLDNTSTPPVYRQMCVAKGKVMAYSQAELLSGVIPENSHKVILLNRDLKGYEVRLKSDRMIINGKPYVPQAADGISRGSSNETYATEYRVIG